MQKISFICDNCGREVVAQGVPCDWFILGFYKVRCMGDTELKLKTPIRTQPQWQETHHFCTSECMDEAVKVKSALQ